eukprot:1108726-Rhodomonas_salina.2
MSWELLLVEKCFCAHGAERRVDEVEGAGVDCAAEACHRHVHLHRQMLDDQRSAKLELHRPRKDAGATGAGGHGKVDGERPGKHA